MAKVTSKPAGKMAVKAGPSGKMHKFGAVGTQKPGGTSVNGPGGNKSPSSGIPAGGKGKIGGKQVGVMAQQPGRTSVR